MIVPIAVIGAAGSVLEHAAAELADGHDADVLHVAAVRIGRQVGIERVEHLRQPLHLVAEVVVAAGRITLAVVRVPTAEVDAGDAQADAGLDQLRDRADDCVAPIRIETGAVPSAASRREVRIPVRRRSEDTGLASRRPKALTGISVDSGEARAAPFRRSARTFLRPPGCATRRNGAGVKIDRAAVMGACRASAQVRRARVAMWTFRAYGQNHPRDRGRSLGLRHLG